MWPIAAQHMNTAAWTGCAIMNETATVSLYMRVNKCDVLTCAHVCQCVGGMHTLTLV